MIISKKVLGHVEKREFKNFILFSLGKFVSIFGSAIYTFAVGLYVLQNTGSGLSFATTLVLGTIPVLLVNPVAGVMADRFDKKKLVVGMDVLNGVILLLVYFLALAYGLSLYMIYISTFLTTACTCIFAMSFEAAKPNIVSRKMLLNINSISKVIDSISSILGPMIGGIIFAFADIHLFILFNGLSYIVSGISEMFIDFKFNINMPEKNLKEDHQVEKFKFTFEVFIKDVKDGYNYVVKRKSLVSMTFIFIILNFFLGLSISVPLPYIINSVLKLSAREFGIIQGALPVGLIIGAMFIKQIIKKVSYNKLLLYANIGIGIAMVLLGSPLMVTKINISSSIYLIYYCVIMSCVGVFISLVDIPIISIFQEFIPEEYRGRVFSLVVTVGKVALPLALIISGYMVNLISPYVLPIIGGVILLILNIFLFKNTKDVSEELVPYEVR